MKKKVLVLSSILFLSISFLNKTQASEQLRFNKALNENGISNTSSTLAYDYLGIIFSNETEHIYARSIKEDSWVQISINLVANMNSVLFINEYVGFAVGYRPNEYESIILKTTDGGLNWTRCTINTRVPIYSIASIDTTTLLAVGGGWTGVAFESVILKTTDQGNSWVRINVPNYQYSFYSVAFRPNGTGVIVGERNYVYKTTNSGTTWTLQHTGTSWEQALSDVCFLDSVHLIAVGTLGNIILSSDLGNSWESGNSSTTRNLYAVKYINGKLFAVGQYGTLRFSTDYGHNWQSQQSGTTADLFGIDFTNSNNGYIVGGSNNLPGNKNVILQSIDSGNTWQKQSHNAYYILKDVFFINEEVGWIVGEQGVLLKTTTGGVTFIEDEENNPTLPEQYLLQQNYPNPFNPTTSIQYAISSTQFVTLKVYDLLGREVATLVNEEKPAGSHNAQFTMNNVLLSSGIYFYKLQAGDFIETKKMILLK